VVTVIWLRHNRARLALHELRPARSPGARPLLLLHGLGERTPARPPACTDGWDGAVVGLDFVGHGSSTRPVGGGYTAEVLMADVDAVLAAVGSVTILGRGLGAYVGLLAAGARPTEVRGVVLADGPGLAGGGTRPGSPYVGPAGLPAGIAGSLSADPPAGPDGPVEAGRDTAPDPWALFELSRDVRPPDYAQEYVRQAMEWSGLERPIVVAAVTRPEWLAAVAAEPGVVEAGVVEALRLLAAAG
jgi:pimeloyl-ACP methyl ester carboxylesterase